MNVAADQLNASLSMQVYTMQLLALMVSLTVACVFVMTFTSTITHRHALLFCVAQQWLSELLYASLPVHLHCTEHYYQL